MLSTKMKYTGRPSCRGVDWNIGPQGPQGIQGGRPSCRGVDWNQCSISTSYYLKVAPRAGAWIETVMIEGKARSYEVAPRAGAWIETLGTPLNIVHTEVAPRAGAWIETL